MKNKKELGEKVKRIKKLAEEHPEAIQHLPKSHQKIIHALLGDKKGDTAEGRGLKSPSPS